MTGTTSEPRLRSRARSRAAASGPRKSESRKTKLPGGQARASARERARPRSSSASSGASKPARSSDAPARLRPSARRLREPQSRRRAASNRPTARARVVGARDDRAHAPSRRPRGLSSHGDGRVVDAPSTARRSSTIATSGASSANVLAHDELVDAVRRREPRRRGPLDRRDRVAAEGRGACPRSRIRARGASCAASPNGLPTSRRREISGKRAAARPRASLPRWDVAEPRRAPSRARARGASSRQRCQTRRAISSASMSVSARNSGSSSRRCATTAANSCSTSSGSAWSRPCTSAQARAARSSARLPRTEAPSDTKSSVRGRADQGHDPALHDRVDVDVVDRLLQLEHVRDRDDGTQRIERMAAALLLRRSAAPRPRPDSRARCAGRSGRAGPRAAGTCPPARSGSRSRSGRTARAAGASRRRRSPAARPSPRAAPTGSSASRG